MDNIEQPVRRITRKEYTALFWEKLEGRSWFPLYFPGPGSPLNWRDLLVFSVVAYRQRLRRTGKITYVEIAEKTSQGREKVADICKKLSGLGLLDEDMGLKEPEFLERLYAIKKKMPLNRNRPVNRVFLSAGLGVKLSSSIHPQEGSDGGTWRSRRALGRRGLPVAGQRPLAEGVLSGSRNLRPHAE